MRDALSPDNIDVSVKRLRNFCIKKQNGNHREDRMLMKG